MIIRIMGEGQLDVADEHLAVLNVLDDALLTALKSGNEVAFHAALGALLDKVREVGSPLPVEALSPSELILPGPDSSIGEVRALLSEEGLIPG
jgi:hypothetical protein